MLYFWKNQHWFNSVYAYIKAWFIQISSANHFSQEGYPLKLRMKDDQKCILTKTSKTTQKKQVDGWAYIIFRIAQINISWNTNWNFIYQLQR